LGTDERKGAIAEAVIGAADSPNGTMTADGAGSTPIAPSTNRVPAALPHDMRQWAALFR